MNRSTRRGLAASLFALGAQAAFAPAAQATTVTPVVIDLKASGQGMSQVVTVGNTSAHPLPVELRVNELTFSGNDTRISDRESGDLLVFPPQALIRPGQSQSFRIQYLGDPALARSKHYYATVAQLPVKMPEGGAAIQVLYNFQVLVGVQPKGTKPALRVASAQVGKNSAGEAAPVIVIINDSVAHGYLSRGKLRIVAVDEAGREVLDRTITGPEIQQTLGYGLVTAGQTRSFVAPIAMPLAGRSVKAVYTEDAR